MQLHLSHSSVLAKSTQLSLVPAYACHVYCQHLFLVCWTSLDNRCTHACRHYEVHLVLLQVLGTDMKKHFDIVSRFQVELMQPLSSQC